MGVLAIFLRTDLGVSSLIAGSATCSVTLSNFLNSVPVSTPIKMGVTMFEKKKRVQCVQSLGKGLADSSCYDQK